MCRERRGLSLRLGCPILPYDVAGAAEGLELLLSIEPLLLRQGLQSALPVKKEPCAHLDGKFQSGRLVQRGQGHVPQIRLPHVSDERRLSIWAERHSSDVTKMPHDLRATEKITFAFDLLD